MSLSAFLNKKIVITQVKGGSKLTEKQKGNLIGLGLRGVNTTSQIEATPSVLGMVRKVNHIVKVALA